MLTNIKFIGLLCVVILYLPKPCALQCADLGGDTCSFNKQCTCGENGQVYCNVGGSTQFPLFSYYNDAPIASIGVYGDFSSVYDNAFSLLISLTNATICLLEASNSHTNLTLYKDSFRTYTKGAIVSLNFQYFNPINLSIISNSEYITSLSITSGNFLAVPDIKRFTSLRDISLQDGAIASLQQGDFNVSSLVNVNLSHNRIPVLSSSAFNFASLKYINAQDNLVSLNGLDTGFSSWLGKSTDNTIDISSAGGTFTCDSSIQWAASYVVCAPQQIKIYSTAFCSPSGPSVLDYLTPYANCGH